MAGFILLTLKSKEMTIANIVFYQYAARCFGVYGIFLNVYGFYFYDVFIFHQS